MSIASANYTNISYVKETVFGETPATPTFKKLPTTGGSPTSDITTAVSETIRSDRQTDDLIVVDADVGGGMDYEISYDNYKPLMISLMQGDPANNIVVSINAASDISVDETSGFDSTTTDFVASGVVAGCRIVTSGFTNTGNNGSHIVASVTANAITVLDLTVLTTESAPGSVDITSEGYRNGAYTPDSYTFLKTVEAVGGNPASYFYYNGCIVSEMSFNFETGSILGGTVSVVGLTETETGTPVAGQSYADADPNLLMNSVTSVAKIGIGGTTAPAKFSNFNLSVNNNVTPAKQIGVLGAADLASFTLEITADISIYFENLEVYQKYKQSSEVWVDVVLNDADGNTLGIYLPKAKFETLETPIEGKDTFLMLEGSLRGLRHGTDNFMIQFDLIDATP
jgi:hypothetical protein